MTSQLLPFDSSPAAPTDLDDSLDVRLMLAGRLSVATIQVRRDRAELAAVLHQSQLPRAQLPIAARWDDAPSDPD